MEPQEEKQEEETQQKMTYWLGNKTSLDISFGGHLYNLTFPSLISANDLVSFASNLRIVANDIFEKQPRKTEEQQPEERQEN